MKRQWIINQKEDKLRIDDFAYQQNISKKTLKSIKMNGSILVDGQPQTVRYHLHSGESLTFLYAQENNNILPVNIPLDIIYEDEYLLIIDKPKNMTCFPTRSHPNHTLANALSYYYQQIGLDSTIHFVNRLDRETTGLMMIAKYREIHALMCKDMQHIYRRYRAHVLGKVDDGIVSLPIYQEGHEMKRIIDKRGKLSCTHYRCLNYHDGISLVECQLETGRTHQIRIHMAALGHPLVGDLLYGDGPGEFDLDSFMVAFTHPVTKQIIVLRKVFHS